MSTRSIMITQSGLQAILQRATNGDNSALNVLNQTGMTIYEICTAGLLGTSVQTPTVDARLTSPKIPVISFKDYGTIAAVLPNGLPSWAQNTKWAAIYDDEDWVLTPSSQQCTPNASYTIAGNAFRKAANTPLAIAAPARDLASVTFTRSPLDSYFLAMGVYTSCAPYFDVTEIQGQNDQPSARPLYLDTQATFNSFVDSATAQILATSPNAIMWCGLAVHGPDVQSIDLGSATAGTIQITYKGLTTTSLARNASAATVQSAMDSLPSLQVSWTSATNGTITQTANGFNNGDLWRPTAVNTNTEITAGTSYYVVQNNANTIHVSATPGGPVITFAAAGSGTATYCIVGGSLPSSGMTFKFTGAQSGANEGLLSVTASGLTGGVLTYGYTRLQAMITSCANRSVADGCSGWWMNVNSNNAAAIAAIVALAGI